MKSAFAICRREVFSFFVSPIAYFVITGFLLLGAYFFFVLLGEFNLYLLQYNQMRMMMGAASAPNLNQFVIEPFYHTLLVVLVLLTPILTMRTFAEDKRRGTFELLATSPLSIGEIVLGKFLGVSFVIFVMLLMVSVFPLLLCVFGNPELLPVISGFVGILLCSLSFAAIGVAASAFTENQIIAAVISFVVLLLLYLSHSAAQGVGQWAGEWASNFLTNLSPFMQTRDFVRGVVTLKSCVYFATLISTGVFLSFRMLEIQRWR